MQFVFADHTLDVDCRELRRGTTPIAVEPQVFDLLTYLVQNRDRVVSKDDLIASVWGGRIVSDSTLTSRINAARKALGDSGEKQSLIRTVARKGIRFVGEVRTGAGAAAPAPATGTPTVQPPAARPAIAVLPFLNLSGEPEQEHIADGISEDVIAALSRLRWFPVIARNSCFAYKGRAVPMRQVAEELGVAYLVEGSVRRSGERLRITAQLNGVASGSQLWAERYDGTLADVFAVQDAIAESVAAAIEPQVLAAEHSRARRKPPENLDAWDLVMRALAHYWRVSAADNAAAEALLRRAAALDPHYSQAQGVLAVSHVFGAHMGWEDRKSAVPAAEAAALAALRADDEDPWAHFGQAGVFVYRGRLADALAEFEAALKLNPSFPLALGHYGLVLAYSGRWREAGAAARRALRLSPRDPLAAIYNAVAAYAEYVGRNYAAAARLAREAVRQRFDFVGGHRVLAAATGMAGDRAAAGAALEALRRVQPGVSVAWIAAELPIPDPAEREHYLEGFRRAGLG